VNTCFGSSERGGFLPISDFCFFLQVFFFNPSLPFCVAPLFVFMATTFFFYCLANSAKCCIAPHWRPSFLAFWRFPRTFLSSSLLPLPPRHYLALGCTVPFFFAMRVFCDIGFRNLNISTAPSDFVSFRFFFWLPRCSPPKPPQNPPPPPKTKTPPQTPHPPPNPPPHQTQPPTPTPNPEICWAKVEGIIFADVAQAAVFSDPFFVSF